MSVRHACRLSEDGAVELPFLADIRRGQRMLIQPDQAHWPALREGDMAVVDTTDRTLVEGQLFAIEESKRPKIWAVWRHDEERHGRLIHKNSDAPECCWWLRPLRRQGPGDADEAFRIAEEQRREDPRRIPVLRLFMSDGPAHESYVQERVIGRVVGIFDPARVAAGAA